MSFPDAANSRRSRKGDSNFIPQTLLSSLKISENSIHLFIIANVFLGSVLKLHIQQ